MGWLEFLKYLVSVLEAVNLRLRCEHGRSLLRVVGISSMPLIQLLLVGWQSLAY